ncbi:hypothetical protein RAK27_05370 [Carnobacterium maltaromaticum]|uniref:Uncharacterized protein n=1 Tax=Carnobacterium maltaromaticum TaxID=2751 RepID=A0AAW9K714_CARML|nr:hypothetical protein [Carnobacterium maltaromaticum]MDZ5758083.1 hypothetical protein [Carnobacterium maltaromaticum]
MKKIARRSIYLFLALVLALVCLVVYFVLAMVFGFIILKIFEMKITWIFLSSLVVIGVAAMLWNVSSWFIEQQQKRKV